MSDETVITLAGNLTADPELRTVKGESVVNFTIASTPRIYDRNARQWSDGQALFMRCSAWRDLADHISATLSKGMRVIAQGRLSQRTYQTNDGQSRTVVELSVDDIGPSLRHATAQVHRQGVAEGFSKPGGIKPQDTREPIPGVPTDPFSQAEAEQAFEPEF
jgi:single-strand DNA-binding protein